MKNIIFKKILILFVISVILISSVSVVCFASPESGFLKSGDVLVFNDVIDSSISPSEILFLDFHVLDNNDNSIYYSRILISFPGRFQLYFSNPSTGLDTLVYDNGWVDSFYQTIYIDETLILDDYWSTFFSINTHGSVSNYYSEIYDIIMGSIYGDSIITSDMELSASLVSTILSMLVVLAPVLVCAFLFIFILKRV